MGYRCCCCCSVTVGSRIWAGFTIFAALFALISDFWSLSEWYLWLFSSCVLIVELVAGIMVFLAVRRRQPRLMIPILVITILGQIFLIVYLGFAIWSCFDDNSPLGQNIQQMWLSLDWFRDYIRDMWNYDLDSYITVFSITLSISIIIAMLLNVWVFVTHYQTYKLISRRLIHCHPIGVASQVHIVPSSYPPPSTYPSPTIQQQTPPPYITAAPVEVLTYPASTTYPPQAGYAFDPAVGKVEQAKF